MSKPKNETPRNCLLCKEDKAFPYWDINELPDVWECHLCGYVWRDPRGVAVQHISRSPHAAAVDKVWFYMANRKVGLKLSDAPNVTRYWIRAWLTGQVKDPSELGWDGFPYPTEHPYRKAYHQGFEAGRTGKGRCPYGPDQPLYYEWKRGEIVGQAAGCARCGAPPRLVEGRDDLWVVSCSGGLHPGDDFFEAEHWEQALEQWNQRQAQFMADATEGE